MSHSEVEVVVDFGDDELTMAWDNPPQAQAPHPEDSSMEDRYFVEYREEDKYGSDSQDGGSQDVSYPDYDAGPNYDPEPDMTGNESPPSNVSDRGDTSYNEFVGYESYAQAVDARDPPSDVSGFDENMLNVSEHRGSSGEDAYNSDTQDTNVRYPPSDSDGCTSRRHDFTRISRETCAGKGSVILIQL